MSNWMQSIATSVRRQAVGRLTLGALASLYLSILCLSILCPALLAQCEYVEVQKIGALDPAPAEFFGSSVAVDGNFLVVGAFGNGRSGSATGIAHLYGGDGNTWNHLQRLTGSDSVSGDRFGFGVAIEGDSIFIGAPLESNVQSQSGSVYVFRKTGSLWTEQQKLIAFDSGRGDSFGRNLCADGDLLVIGAHQDDDFGSSSGSVHCYQYNGSQWEFTQKLNASDSNVGSFFGSSLALHDGVLLVGAEGADFGTGAAYIFRRTDGVWIEERKLTASPFSPANQFGLSVALDKDLAAVGASSPEKVYVFERRNGTWATDRILLSPTEKEGDDFATSLAAGPDLIVVGARNRQVGSHVGAGSISVFVRTAGVWELDQTLEASDRNAQDSFATALAIDGSLLAVGADLDDDSGSASGSVYILSQIGTANRGTVNAGAGEIRNVLFLNDSVGTGLSRVVEYNVLGQIEIKMRIPPSLVPGQIAQFALYSWGHGPGPLSGRVLPLGIGCTALPIPYTLGDPQPTIIWNNAGRFAKLGRPTHPSSPAPSIVFRRRVLRRVTTFYIQGVIYDPGSAALVQASVTNGILARPVFGQ